MNTVRSILIAGILIAVGTSTTVQVSAQTNDRTAPVPMRIATKQTSVGGLIRSRFEDVQLVNNQSGFDDLNQALRVGEESERSDGQEADSRGEEADSRGEEADSRDEKADNRDEEEPEYNSGLADFLDSINDDQSRQRSMATRISALKKRVTEISIRVSADGATPLDRAEQLSHAQPMIAIAALGFGPTLPNRYTTCFMHRPLYFEQRNLERCGNAYGCWQNGVSGFQFLSNTVLLPYHLGQHRCDFTYPAGGDCKCCESFPCDCNLTPVSCRALTTQAAAIAGFTLLVL